MKARVEARRAAFETARRQLPTRIAALSAEANGLLEAMRKMSGAGAGARLFGTRSQEVGEQLARAEAQLAEAERAMANLDAVEVEAGWVARCLAEFGTVWEMLTPENRARLVRAVVERVEVDEPENRICVVLADLGGEPEAEPGTEMARKEAEAA